MALVTALGTGTYLLVPNAASAFWPFAKASAAEPTQPLLHDPSLELLQAAVNSDPNPTSGPVELALSEDSALMGTAGPDGTLPPDTETTNTDSSVNPNGSISVYVVKEGDSLSGIAAKFGVTMNTILWANDIKDPKTIHPGTSLIILPVSGVEHTVGKGETLNGIAAKYHADAGDIASFNGLGADASVTPGQQLIIPGGELTSITKPSSGGKSSSSGRIKTGGSLANVQANPYRGGSGAPIPGYFGNPLPGGLITQGIHGWNAVDIGAPAGTPIYAAAGGTVIVSKIGGYNGGYGNYVVIDHGNGTQTLYAHFSSISVSVGQTVSRGEELGGVGRTGDATGNHLHFEVRGAANPFADCSVMTTCSPG